jgi:hypothetical protein
MTMTTFGRSAIAGTAFPNGLATELATGSPAPIALLQATVNAAIAVGTMTDAAHLPPGSLAR